MQLLSAATSLVVLLLTLLQTHAATAADAPTSSGNNSSTEDLTVLACSASVTVENQVLGFSAEFDSTCEVDKTDCFQSVCRMCKVMDNEHTGPYRFCQSESAGLMLLEAAAALPPTSAECAARVASGDKSVGISAIYDSSCANGGLGCFGPDRCRYCRVTTTKQSENFVPCSELSSTTTGTAASQVSCVSAASNSGLSDVASITDALCQTNARLAGCVTASSCRLCRNAKNEGNQYLLSCKVLRERQQLAQTTTSVTAMTTTMAFALASATSEEAPPSPPSETSSSSEEETTPEFAAAGAGALAGIVVALAAVAARASRTRRIADRQDMDAGALHRIDSILHEVGRDRIAQL